MTTHRDGLAHNSARIGSARRHPVGIGHGHWRGWRWQFIDGQLPLALPVVMRQAAGEAVFRIANFARKRRRKSSTRQ